MRLATIAIALALMLVDRDGAAELKAGVAKTDVTPPIGGQMYGYGARGTNVSEGVHDNRSQVIPRLDIRKNVGHPRDVAVVDDRRAFDVRDELRDILQIDGPLRIPPSDWNVAQ